MRWLVTGAAGMLGTDLVSRLDAAGEDVTGVARGDLDITSEASVERAMDGDGDGYDVVVNCAAWTAVDDAEQDADAAWQVNARGPDLLARAARARGIRIVQVSTDYVFDGGADRPYSEDAAVAPRSAYGRTKLAGEQAVRRAHPDGHLVVRTAWLYGAHGPCFPRTIARLLREKAAVEVVADQFGQPTWTADVAAQVLDLVEAGAQGTFHATSSGIASWFVFARAVAEAAGLDTGAVAPVDSSAFPRPAPRPAYSVLGHSRTRTLGVEPIGDWQERWAAAAPALLSAWS